MLSRLSIVLVAFVVMIAGCSRETRPPDGTRDTLVARPCRVGSVSLTELGEPSLRSFEDSATTEMVRFLWFPTFHGSASVRAIRRDSVHALVSARHIPQDSTQPSPAPRRDSLPLSAARWEALTAAVEADGFWTPEPPTQNIRLDGSTWVVERVAGGTCQAVQYWSPERGGRGAMVRAFGETMLQAAGIVPEHIY